MEYLLQWEFWQDVGLTAAARLSVVAVALWAVKVALDYLRERPPVEKFPQRTAGLVTPGVLPPIRLPGAGGVKEFRPLDERRHSLTLKRSERVTVERLASWRQRMEQYLSGEPHASASASGQQRRGDR